MNGSDSPPSQMGKVANNKALQVDWPLGRGVKVVSLDANGLAALIKPIGLLSHPNGPKDRTRSLLSADYDGRGECYHLTADGAERRLYLLNRLDSATSGLVLVAENFTVAEAVRNLLAKGEVEKTYLALVFGVMKPARQVWKDRLGVKKAGGKLRATSGEGGVFAETAAFSLRVFPGLPPISLLELKPRTGRTHQLRVQCGRRQLPIIGDQTYGKFSWNREHARGGGTKRLHLHSAEVSLTYEYKGKRHRFTASAPLPAEFNPVP